MKPVDARQHNRHLQQRAGWWYFVMEWDGDRIRRSCHTRDVACARRFRDQLEREIWAAGMLPAPPEAPLPVATVAEVFEDYEAGPLESQAVTRRRTVQVVRNILRRAGIEAPDGLPADRVFTKGTLGAYREAVLRECAGLEQARVAQVKASANSMLNQAAALFCGEACALFERHGTVAPSAEEWRKHCRVVMFSVASARRRFVAPSEAVVRAVFAGLDGLAAGEDRNLARAVGLCLGGGLRKGEAAQVRWEWITRDAEGWLIDGAAAVKDGSGALRQRLLGWVWDRVSRMGSGVSGFVLDGTETERGEGVFRRVSAWMRSLGWSAHKTAHGLRDLAISAVIAEAENPYAGKKFARHANVAVTEAHYGHFAEERWMRELVAEMKRPGG